MLIKKEEKMMSKRKKKGFTLIELIVVIAILGILAAIAIPRLAGFTDKAKISSDNELGVLLGHTAVTMVADGDIAKTSGTAADDTIIATKQADDTHFVTFSAGDGVTPKNEVTLATELGNLVGNDKKMQYYDTITVTLDANGEISTIVGKKGEVSTTIK